MSNANHRAAGLAGALILVCGPLARESLVERHLEGMIVTEHASIDFVTAEPPPLPEEFVMYLREERQIEVSAFPLMNKKSRRRGQRESIRGQFDKRRRRG